MDKIKILLSYHKKDILFKDSILTPVHAGREIAIQTKDPLDENLIWLLKNTIGDNTGDNISLKNPLYNEMTTVYWAWKNYAVLGNPDYIGFMHYRRHFIFKKMPNVVYECAEADENYFDTIGYSAEKLQKIMKTCDFVCAAPHYRNTVYDHYKKNHDIADLDCVIDIIDEKWPDYSKDAQKYLQGSSAYFCNMFIFDRNTFFEYCTWLFDITFELEKRRNMEGKRLFVSEWLTGIFVTRLLRLGKKGCFLPTMIIEGEHVIPLVFAADNNYAIPMFTAIVSAFETAKINTTYEVHLLLSGNISADNYNKLEILKSKYPRHNIIIHHMDNQYENIGLNIAHTTSATYYRLKLPSLLKEVKKCIYLDVDLIVNQDLSELFRTNVDDKYLAGVRAAGYFWPEQHVKTRLNSLEIPSIEQYVNAGVLIMNLEKMRKNNLENVFETFIDYNYQSQDQDILNKACYGMIRILPFKYNAMIKYHLLDDKSYEKEKMLQLAYTLDEWEQGRKYPAIIHYADKIKPWSDLSVDYAQKWWDIAAKLPFFDEIFINYTDEVFKNARKIIPLRNELSIKEKENRELRRKYELKVKNESDEDRAKVQKKKISAYDMLKKAKGGIKCAKEHGMVYTIKYAIYKLKNYEG